MAAKKPPGPTEMKPVFFTSGVKPHTNHQQLPANAATGVAEAVATPGVTDDVAAGGAMVIVAAWLTSGHLPADALAALINVCRWTTQLQTGNREAANTLLTPIQIGYFAELSITNNFVGSGYAGLKEPVAIPIMTPNPYVVMPHFTIQHTGLNTPSHNDMHAYTIIWYRTARLHSSLHAQILANQTRIS